ncbi:hypothetical protein [Streptomyces sp. NPDC018693]
MSAASERRKARKAYAAGQQQRSEARLGDDIARRDGAQGGGAR